MARQLSFDWPPGIALAREDFFVAPANENAFAMIGDPGRWPLGKLALVGPEGAGKSHLARVFAADTGAEILDATRLRPGPPPTRPTVIEDADRLPEAAEEPLFHLHNNLAASGLPLLLTARTPPARWRIRLPDLASRMQATTPVAIADPGDDLLRAVLMKHFADRQIAPSSALIDWLVSRIERSFAAAADIVARLDREALAQRRPLGRRLAADLLDTDPPRGG